MSFTKRVFIVFLITTSQPLFGQEIDYPFQVGEELNYKIKYGWVTIGKAFAGIPSDTIFRNQKSFNVEAISRTAGLLGLFNNTVDRFKAVISQSELKPFIASQNFLDAGKRDIQTNTFNYDSGTVHVERIRYKKGPEKESKSYTINQTTLDILSSYLYLRSIDISSLEVEDSVMVDMFFGKKHYLFGMEYGGKEVITTNFGEFETHKLYVLFPLSKAFPYEKSVVVWTTTDVNQLPLRAEAKLRIGHVSMDLESYKNIKSPIE